MMAQKKLEKFRKLNKDYLFPSFDTIAGTGSNGAIVHYKATKKSDKLIKDKDQTIKSQPKGKKRNDSLRQSKTSHADKRVKLRGANDDKIERPAANESRNEDYSFKNINTQ